MWIKRLAIVMLFAATPAFGAARHVYLNQSGGGSQLDDCPSPAHNVKGTSNTDELTYCASALLANALNRFICDAGALCKPWTTTTGICESGANLGTVTPVTNGVTINFGDVGSAASNSIVYGHPQACVWNMQTSDSCEVHAGTYIASGAYADSNSSNDLGNGAGCDKQNCIYATVIAPGPASGAYGTAVAPGYLRAAVMNGSTDNWDPNGDKNPADGVYPVIFSGDRDNDGTFDATSGNDGDNTGTFTGTGGAFNGDAFVAVWVGCGAPGTSDYSWCDAPGHADNPWIDTDADGDFDTRGNVAGLSSRNPDYFTIKDIEMTRYNGGHPNRATGSRAYSGNIILSGDGSTSGLVVDHVYVHSNAYSLQFAGGNIDENFWAIIDDSHNDHCATWTEIKNSNLEQNNDKLLDDDCGVEQECGCPKNFHDNLVLVNVTGNGTDDNQSLFYIKSVDGIRGGQKKVHRFWNNEFVLSSTMTTTVHAFMDLQAFGDAQGGITHPVGQGLGEIWVYGNIFRALGTPKMKRFWLGACGVGTGSWRYYSFNNTWDMTFVSNSNGIYQICEGSGELVVEKNNAYWSGSTNINTHDSPASLRIAAQEYCSASDLPSCNTPAQTTHAQWFTGTATTLYNGTAALRPTTSGPLDETAFCDPDELGTCVGGTTPNAICGTGQPTCGGGGTCGNRAGVDYDWDGVNDTEWRDLSGQLVQCPTAVTTLDAGAMQSTPDGGGGAVCGNNIVESGETCDDGSQAVNACVYGDSPPLQQVCNATCDGNTDCDDPRYCGDSDVDPEEPCEPSNLNGHGCAEFGCTFGTPTCVIGSPALCILSSAGCTSCAALNPDLIGVDIFGVSINP
jgi:hypothetical protein